MSETPLNEWNSASDISRKISLGTHSLYLSASGPPRAPDTPIVLILPGLGSTASEWVAVRRLLNPFIRNVIYDRSGLGQSDSRTPAPDIITAASAASELALLLEMANIQGPFIVVCHSWGGISAREFLDLRQRDGDDDIVGMVFVDANQERSPDPGKLFGAPGALALTKDLDYMDVVGIKKNHKLTAKEWEAFVKEDSNPRDKVTEQAEMAGVTLSYEELTQKKQLERDPRILGNRPVSVLKGDTAGDFKLMYDAAVAAGAGTEEHRRYFRALIADWEATDHTLQEEILKLTGNGRSVQTKSGHNMQFTHPETIVEEVRWVLKQLS